MFVKKFVNRVQDMFTQRNDPYIWSRELERHFAGSYSYACVRARPEPEQLEFSHVELGSGTIFVGIYDGHNGSEVAVHAYQNLFNHLIDAVLSQRTALDDEKLTQAVNAMENQIIQLSREDGTQKFATVGSSCLIVLIRNRMVYVRNLGEGKCVVGSKYGKTISPEQINEVDNLQREAERIHFQRQHPEPDAFTADDSGAFLVKGKLKVTKSLGDAYLKYDDCAVDAPHLVRFHIPGPTSRPYLTAQVQNPSHTSSYLGNQQKFVIIASNGLWDFLSNEEATRIVETHPKEGIARILIQEAQKVAARLNHYPYVNLRNNINNRHEVHDDMTVVVIFLNAKKLRGRNYALPKVSVRAFSDANQDSRFIAMEEVRP